MHAERSPTVVPSTIESAAAIRDDDRNNIVAVVVVVVKWKSWLP